MATISYLAVILSLQFVFTLARVPLRCFIENERPSREFGKVLFEQDFETLQKEQLNLGNIILKDYEINQDGFFLQSKAFQILGFENAIVDDIGINFNSNLSRVTYHTDTVLKGPYKVGGSLFSIPIEGEGDIEIKYKNAQVDMVMPFEIIQDESGKRFINLKSYSYSYDIKDGSIRLNNLFGGNKAFSDSMHYIINQNWKLITFLFGNGGAEQVFDHIFNVFKKNLFRMPIRESC